MSGSWIVLIGDPLNGYQVVGPFSSEKSANDWGARYAGITRWSVKLQKPNSPDWGASDWRDETSSNISLFEQIRRDALTLEEREGQISPTEAALSVFLTDRVLRNVLQALDPEAVRQARKALGLENAHLP